MTGYNFTGDESILFPNGYIQDIQTHVTASNSGQLTKGCFFQTNTMDLAQVNSSWANTANTAGFDYSTSAASDTQALFDLTANTTNCGISPNLNVTLLNATADDNPAPYKTYT